MLKKLLAIAAVASVGIAANAEIVVDYEKDWSKADKWEGYVMGFVPEIKDEALWAQWPNFDYKRVYDNPDNAEEKGLGEGLEYDIVKLNGVEYYIVPCTDADGNPCLRDEWGIQFHVAPGNVETEAGVNYTLTVVAKSTRTDCTLNFPMSWNWSGGTCNGGVTLGTEYQELELNYDECGGSPCWIVAQLPGSCKTDDEGNATQIWIKSIKVTHDAKPKSPETWENLLTNGDAEAEVPAHDPEDAAFTNFCAVSKTWLGSRDVPEVIYPTVRVQEGDNWVYMVDAPAVDKELFKLAEPDANGNEYDGAYTWMNQFWINCPRTFAANESFRVSFKYKATFAHSAGTQAHANPSNFLHWSCIGDVNFTEEWQEFSKVVTVSSEMNGMHSIAFNLSQNGYVQPVKYYFDDIKWEVLKLEEGYFVAGDFNDWDYGTALKFDFDEEGETYTKTFGSAEKPASEIRISTRKGQDAAFVTNSLAVAAAEGIEVEEPYDFTVGNGKKIALPEKGVWMAEIDEANKQVVFYNMGESGIEGVSVENVAPVYYNLQGVKVAAPVKGQVVIVKRGNKVSKEIAR